MHTKPGSLPRSLVIDMEVGECLQVIVGPDVRADDQTVSVTMLAKSGKRARLRVLASPGIRVQRDKIPVAC